MGLRAPSLPLLCALLIACFSAFAASPPSNTIPIISMKTGQDATCEDITMDVLLMLLRQNFDGIWAEGRLSDYVELPAVLCDSTNAVMVFAPARLQAFCAWPPTRWGRYTDHSLSSSSAFMLPSTDWTSIDSLKSAPQMIRQINSRCATLAANVDAYDCIWYFDIFNEGPAKQLSHMLDDTTGYDDFIPSMYTQDVSMTDVLPDGVFSWVKWKSDSLYSGDIPYVSFCHSMLHTIEDGEWAGFGGISLGTDTIQQANSVKAYFDMEYLRYSDLVPYDTLDNTPVRMDLNSYPIRLAGHYWQTVTADSITVLGSATDLWMLGHYEDLMDSTFIPAGNHARGHFPINYHPQAFGRTGGRAIWSIDTTVTPNDTLLSYNPYAYRVPSPSEFRMLCNIGLLRGAKGVFPYSIRSYESWSQDTLLFHDTGLLDENLIPFDAPYEDWVYRDRPTGDYWYAPPDSIPPWTAADGSQFDPLYALPSRPATTGAKAREAYLEWKFAAYGRLWNSVKATFGRIAWVAPELAGLWWWFSGDRYDNAFISYQGTEPQYFADPHIRVFTDSTESTCYLFYVNRFCRAEDNPFEIAIGSGEFPSTVPFSEYALDHSRRFLIEGTETASDEFSFLDTLDAGEARLLEMFDDGEGLEADLRITDPDIFVVIPADGDTLTDNASVAGTPFDPYAWVYNMGTEPLSSIKVYLADITTDTTLIDSVYLSFSGLSTGSCYQTDRALASFKTITPDTSDIGVNIFRIFTEGIHDEPDPSDNSATLVYLVRPGNYASEILDDPWDMDPPLPPISPPAWKTFDIDSLTGCWGGYTDSISGMFEGVLSNPTQSNHLYLNTGTGSSEYIDADRFHNFWIAGRSERTVTMGVYWIDSHDNTGYIAVVDTLEATAADHGPYDLSALSEDWTGDIRKLWLEFHGSNVSSNVRIGWVKLTE